MKIINKKTVFIAGFFALSVLLTACGNNGSTDIPDSQREQEETVTRDTELQEAIDVFMYDTIPFMDGTACSKNDAAWGNTFEYDNGEKKSVLGFDFAFMRYAMPIYSDTDTDPDLYDFDDYEYSIANLWDNIEGAEYFKVTAGQKLENGLTVLKSFCTVPAVFDDGAHIGVNEIYLEGSITTDGVLEYYEQDEYILPKGSVLFYPNPLSCDNLPVSYGGSLCTTGSADLDGKFAFQNDGARFYVGNINEIDADISDYFEHGKLVKVKATLSDITLRYDESTGGNVSNAVLIEVKLAD